WYGPYYYPYYPYGYYPGYYYEGYAGDPRGSFARIKTDVSPEEARVYLDGRYIGSADDFDGWPDYLYLGRGRYKLEFRLAGYESQMVDVDARPGTTLKIDNKLRKVPGAKEYGSYDEPTLEGGIRRFWTKRQNATEPVGPYGRRREYSRDERRDDSDVDRYDDERGRESYEEQPAPPSSDQSWRDGRRAPDSTVRARPDAAAKTRLRLKVSPSDAAVYLDDRFIGTAEEVNSLERGVAVSPGRHTVTISRPGFRDRSRQIEVTAGDSPSLELSLEK
ncbi:MAG TPA: PEGA domain-containing protein, partial [Thermoanaerobaculia bacterium]